MRLLGGLFVAGCLWGDAPVNTFNVCFMTLLVWVPYWILEKVERMVRE